LISFIDIFNLEVWKLELNICAEFQYLDVFIKSHILNMEAF